MGLDFVSYPWHSIGIQREEESGLRSLAALVVSGAS